MANDLDTGRAQANLRVGRGIPVRALVPNMVTALALCTGLSGVWFAIGGHWAMAAGAVLGAGVLDGLDGRIARLLKGESRFGAELDSLSDVIAFGVTPAVVMFLWSLQYMPKFGWTVSLFYAVCCALRLARFNARIDTEDQPHKSAGFLTGVPAPAGAGLALLPLFAALIPGVDFTRSYIVVAPCLLGAALLMLSSVATYSWSSMKVRKPVRLAAIAVVCLVFAALIAEPWLTLVAVCLVYLALIPFSIISYRRVRRLRAKSHFVSEPS